MDEKIEAKVEPPKVMARPAAPKVTPRVMAKPAPTRPTPEPVAEPVIDDEDAHFSDTVRAERAAGRAALAKIMK